MATRPRVSVVEQMPRMPRGIRRPTVQWKVSNPAFTLQPCCIHPVLPGETLKNARFMVRAVTDPVNDRLAGWWLEHYLFYVPISAINALVGGAAPGTIKTMFIDGGTTLQAATTRSNVNYLKDDAGPNTGYDWLEQCLRCIVNRWFRDEADTYALAAGVFNAAPPGDGKWYKVKAEPPGWMDSLRLKTTAETDDVALIDAATTDVLYASEVEKAMNQWELLRYQGLTQQTYEEYLQTFRVHVPQEPGVGEVELLRYSRSWQYPSNTVNPATGAVTTAVSWSVSESADKDRFFKEPGFVVVATCARPKVYFAKQTSYPAAVMYDAMAWLPATLWNNYKVGIRDLAVDQVLKDFPSVAQFDVRDLLVYGDQFVGGSIALTATTKSMVNLPTSTNRLFPVDADIKALFVDTVTNYNIEQDGRIDFTIASPVQDPEPVLGSA